jgi:predicted MPP superfamily phosphohydrolase
MNRRKFIKTSAYTLAGLSLCGGIYTWQVEPYWLQFRHIKMPIQNLPEKLIGRTLMQVSDIHVGNRFDHQFLIKSFEAAKKYTPDIVVYTGDYITLHDDKVENEKLKEVLASCVKGRIATIGILGNHDYGNNWSQHKVADNIYLLLIINGFTVLRNASIEVEGLNITGFDDYWGLNFGGENVMKNYDSSKANIVLCHNPDVCDLPIWNNYAGWILSGHTHGGQVKPPFLNPPILPVKNKRYTAGKILLGDNRILYINRALGHLWPVRFNVRPEITIFELQKI